MAPPPTSTSTSSSNSNSNAIPQQNWQLLFRQHVAVLEAHVELLESLSSSSSLSSSDGNRVREREVEGMLARARMALLDARRGCVQPEKEEERGRVVKRRRVEDESEVVRKREKSEERQREGEDCDIADRILRFPVLIGRRKVGLGLGLGLAGVRDGKRKRSVSASGSIAEHGDTCAEERERAGKRVRREEEGEGRNKRGRDQEDRVVCEPQAEADGGRRKRRREG